MSIRRTLLALLVGAPLAACGGGGSGPNGAAFVKSQIGRTSDTADPVPIDGLDLRFAESTSAFEDLFR